MEVEWRCSALGRAVRQARVSQNNRVENRGPPVRERASHTKRSLSRLGLLSEVGLVDVADPSLSERLAGKVSEQLVTFALKMRNELLATSVENRLGCDGRSRRRRRDRGRRAEGPLRPSATSSTICPKRSDHGCAASCAPPALGGQPRLDQCVASGVPTPTCRRPPLQPRHRGRACRRAEHVDQTVETLGGEPMPPLADRDRIAAHLSGDPPWTSSVAPGFRVDTPS